VTAYVVPGNRWIVRAAAHDLLVGGKRDFQIGIINHGNAVVNVFLKKTLRTALPAMVD